VQSSIDNLLQEDIQAETPPNLMGFRFQDSFIRSPIYGQVLEVMWPRKLARIETSGSADGAKGWCAGSPLSTLSSRRHIGLSGRRTETNIEHDWPDSSVRIPKWRRLERVLNGDPAQHPSAHRLHYHWSQCVPIF